MGNHESPSTESGDTVSENSYGNLIGNRISYVGDTYQVTSPVTNKTVGQIYLANKADISNAISDLDPSKYMPSMTEVFEFLNRLKDQLEINRDRIFEQAYLETGFIAEDTTEIVDGAIEYLNDFEIYAGKDQRHERIIRHSYSSATGRDMRMIDRPFRCIAAVVPQNASLTLGIVIIASALCAGSRVILRPSLQTGTTGALLAEAILKSEPPESCISIVNCLAKDFLEACNESENVDLIHYIGSNQYAMPVFSNAFSAGKVCLIDGQGNGMLYVDDTFSIEEAVRIVTSGATRYNGGTCTSINGVLIKDTIYKPFKEALVEAFTNLRVGHPLEQNTQVGPLFSDKQATLLKQNISDSAEARILCGGNVKNAYFSPAVIENVSLDSTIVREGMFGPALWLKQVSEEEMWQWLKANRFPLSDTILSTNKELIRSFAVNSRAARICVNSDPSIESMFEPWGGYPPSGLNPVSTWIDKYRQTFQLDGTLADIMTVNTDTRSRHS